MSSPSCSAVNVSRIQSAKSEILFTDGVGFSVKSESKNVSCGFSLVARSPVSPIQASGNVCFSGLFSWALTELEWHWMQHSGIAVLVLFWCSLKWKHRVTEGTEFCFLRFLLRVVGKVGSTSEILAGARLLLTISL